MQVLEERFLRGLLPSCGGLDLLDLGCGTGRWLKRLAESGASSLTGVDSSPEMLARAAASEFTSIRAVLASCEALPLPSSSADLILCSFALSHVEDLRRFVREVARVARAGAQVFVTDLHPGTVSLLGWRRGFRVDGMHVDIEMKCRPLEEIASAFRKCGFTLSVRLEPGFGEPERAVFEKAGKGGAFDALRKHPAIYILQFTKAATRGNRRPPISRAARPGISGARIALGAGEAGQANLQIHAGRIESLACTNSTSKKASAASRPSIDLSGFLLLPGMVNAHDHLEFALFPRLGSGNYRNYVEWSRDIYHPEASPVREQLAVPKSARLLWGGIRNLLCGVTTVCHHNPYARGVFGRDFPVRVVRNFRWAHSLALGKDVAAEYNRAPKEHPFVIHLCEGVDERSAGEIFELQRTGGLDSRTVLVHGLGLDARGMHLVRASGAALIWCPSSNVFLFGRTHSRESLSGFAQIALGNDSPLTAQGDLLDEIHFAHSGIGIPAEELYEQVTWRAARVLRLAAGEGSLRPGALDDFVAVRDRGLTPAETLMMITWRDVELVVVGGRVHLASPRLYERLPRRMTRGLERLNVEGETRWIRAPISRLLRVTSAALGAQIRLGGRKVSNEFAS